MIRYILDSYDSCLPIPLLLVEGDHDCFKTNSSNCISSDCNGTRTHNHLVR